MTFYCRVWVSDGSALFVNSNTTPITRDIAEIQGYDLKIDAEVGGEYMYADEVRGTASVENGVLSIEGRDVVRQWQS